MSSMSRAAVENLGSREARRRAKAAERRQWLTVEGRVLEVTKARAAVVRGVEGRVMLERGRGWKGEVGEGSVILMVWGGSVLERKKFGRLEFWQVYENWYVR